MDKNSPTLEEKQSSLKFSAQTERAALIALHAVPGIGLKSFWRLFWAFRSTQTKAEEFWEGKHGIWKKFFLTEKQQESIKNFKKEHNFLEYEESLFASNVQTLVFTDQLYPNLLKEIFAPPPVLFVKSKLKLEKVLNASLQFPISVVGTRKMTPYGKYLIQEFIPDLLEAGASIISGYMSGVDFTAQDCCLNSGGKTLGVLGYGFNYAFPEEQARAMQDFLERGAIFLTEYPADVRPKAGNFVQRNRIIAGLSLATLVIEAAKKSGSHITAHFAADYGRLVFAIPGPISNPFSEGTKDLIKDGAILVNSAAELLSEVQEDYSLNESLHEKNDKKVSEEGGQKAKENKQVIELNDPMKHFLFPLEDTLEESEKRILVFLQARGEVSFAEIQKETAIASSELLFNLIQLEMSGRIVENFSYYSLKNQRKRAKI